MLVSVAEASVNASPWRVTKCQRVFDLVVEASVAVAETSSWRVGVLVLEVEASVILDETSLCVCAGGRGVWHIR